MRLVQFLSLSPCLQKWPKLKSRLKVLLSYELWKGHLKEVEGSFGTAVVSYFTFLRFLYAMNAFVTIFWYSFIVIPMIVFLLTNNPPSAASTLACAYQPVNTSELLCPTDSLSLLDTNQTLEDDGTFVYQLNVPGEYSCEFPAMVNGEAVEVDTFEVRNCDFGDTIMNGSLEYRLAEKEGVSVLNVSTIPVTGVSTWCMFMYVCACACDWTSTAPHHIR